MKRTPLERKTPLKRTAFRVDPAKAKPLKARSALERTPMKQGRSRKQRRDAAALALVTPALRARSGNKCEAWFPGCTRTATHRHHRQSRRRGDHRLVNLLHVCGDCHAFGHAHPEMSYKIGFLVKANGLIKPEEVPFYGVSGRPLELDPTRARGDNDGYRYRSRKRV